MPKRKKTVVHGTLGMPLMAWKFNSKQLLSKTLNSRMNRIKTRAVSNIVKKNGKWVLEAKMGESRNNPKVFIFGQSKTLVKYYLISRYIYTHVDHGANLTQSQSGPKTLQSGEF